MHNHRNGLKTAALFGLIWAVLLGMGAIVASYTRNSTFIVVFALFGVATTFWSYWNSDKIAIRAMHAQPVTEAQAPAMYRIVRELSERAGQPMPRLYISPTEAPNAFATGRNPQNAAVAATTGIMRILSRDELEGVMAHELTHVMNRDTLVSTIAATIAGAISMLGNMLQWAAIFGMGRSDDEEGGGGIFGALAMAIIAPIAAMLIQMAVSRSREFMADEGGAKMCGKPKALASALMKLQQASTMVPMQEATPATSHMFIINPLTAGKLASLFSTHPSTEDRVARLMAM